jgi:hypothetical protein
MDETAVSADSKRFTVVVPKEAKRVIRKDQGHFNHHMTLIMCISASGGAVDLPTLILPLANIPRLSEKVYNSYHFAGSDTGWITAMLWGQWITEVFIPHVVKVRDELKATGGKKNLKALLWMDSHASRLNISAIEALEASEIVPATIPSHSSHVLQPLDCGVNNSLKKNLRNFSNQGKVIWNQGLERYRTTVLECVTGALHNAQNPMVIREAFRTTGLYPWDPEVVLSNGAKVRVDDSVRSEPEFPNATQSISGKVVTSKRMKAHNKQVQDNKIEADAAKKAKQALREAKKEADAMEKEKKEAEKEIERQQKEAAKAAKELASQQREQIKKAQVEAKQKLPKAKHDITRALPTADKGKHVSI